MYQVCKIKRNGEIKSYENLSEKKANCLYALFKATSKITKHITVKSSTI